MLDVCGTELNPLGYNHDSFKALINGCKADSGIINQCAGGQYASATYSADVKSVLGAVAPEGMNGITLIHEPNATGEAVRSAITERDGAGIICHFKGSTHGKHMYGGVHHG